jgi:hypothetical protein
MRFIYFLYLGVDGCIQVDDDHGARAQKGPTCSGSSDFFLSMADESLDWGLDTPSKVHADQTLNTALHCKVRRSTS